MLLKSAHFEQIKKGRCVMNSPSRFGRDIAKAGLKKAAIGFAFLALLALPESANALNSFPRSYYNIGASLVRTVPVGTSLSIGGGYYGSQYRGMGYRGMGYGGMGYRGMGYRGMGYRGMGYGRGYAFDYPIYEREGQITIRKYLRSKNIKFRMNRPFRINDITIKPDFKLGNDVIIEYWSPEDVQDSEYIKRDYGRYKQIVTQEINIVSEEIKRDWTLTEKQREEIISQYLNQRAIKCEGNPVSNINYTITRPDFLLDKKEIYEKYKKMGGKVYLIELKDTEDAVNIEQELDEILGEITRERILTEKQAEEIISEYLKSKNIRFEMNGSIRTINGRRITPDFLLENGVAIEYWSKDDRRHPGHNEWIYEKYRETEEGFYLIKSGDKAEILDKLNAIVNGISD